ncbi:MAG: NAD(P)-dependent alcohol dehydrogenase [Acidobacteria bacterium]|nr:NAD(P)-dependent alcohol dehydrogenase [Acidobacteriota bacterium]
MDTTKDGKNHVTRRNFVGGTAAVGAAAMMTGPASLFAAKPEKPEGLVRGYAAFDASGTLKPWQFERRPMGDRDVLIDVKFASICHSDIHQMKGDWGPQKYPQVPGHEIVGLVAAVGSQVTAFKVGDRAGVGCMVDSCMTCDRCIHGEEHLCERGETLFTYGYPDEREPTGITQGGYSTQIVVRDHFAVHIPENISLAEAAPLLCAGITTYSPIMQARFDVGDKIGVAGIGGLGHMAVKLAVSKGAEVFAFTTSPSKVDDIRAFGAEPVVVDGPEAFLAHRGTLDWMISTIPVKYDVASYVSVVKPHGTFTQVGMPDRFELTLNALALASSRVNFNASLIGGMPETQEVVHYCADNEVRPQIEMIRADQVNEAWAKMVGKEARYRFVIDAATF